MDGTLEGLAKDLTIWLKQYDREYLEIECGEWSYGRPTLKLADKDYPRKFKIGRYCSIGEEVAIFVGRQGRHNVNTLSSYPLIMAIGETRPKARSATSMVERFGNMNLDVIIGDDVWIGSRVTIAAGVTIGTGAIIGTGAFVNKDVPPYAIAVGVPARTERYRHDPATIGRLMQSRWWEFQPEELWDICGVSLESEDVSASLDSIDGHRSARSAPVAKPAINPRRPPLADISIERMYSLLTSPEGAAARIPQWPAEEKQLQFTGGYGLPLLNRARTFIEALSEDGAFANSEWRGLDYGCGWGRIASYLLSRGQPEQLDMCDAWEGSLDLSREAGFTNRLFKVSDVVQDAEVPQKTYDFCYAMSVFTHLNRDAFENNLEKLSQSIKAGGTLYFTVRHHKFLDELKSAGKVQSDAALDAEGFWHTTYPNHTCYGETVVSPSYVFAVGQKLGRVEYVSTPEYEQHLYKISM